MSPEPSPDVTARVAGLLGWTPASWRPVAGGYTPAARYVAAKGDERVFVKVATTPLTATFLRREGFVYERLGGTFMPRFFGWDDHESQPLLIIEDLSQAHWQPPWGRGTLDTVLEQLDWLHATKAELPSFPDVHGAIPGGWATIAQDPMPFLSLGLTTREWLARSLPRLVEAEADCRLEGSSVVHFDLRSDNICVTATGAKFVDWPAACLGNPELDLGGWLPSLCYEGGPLPESLLPNAPEVAAWVSGYFAARAGLPIIPDAPFVRRVQREQLSTALPWVTRALGLNDL
jgi:thiamine kinase-like enzyme